MTYPDQYGPTITGVTPCGTPFDRVVIDPPGSTILNYRRFRMHVPDPYVGPVVMVFHGNGNDENVLDKAGLVPMVNTWLDQGWIVVAPRSLTVANQSAWGNQDSLDGMESAWDWLVANFTPTSVLGYGVSMGGLVGFNLLASNQVPMLGFVSNSGVCDLEAIYYAGNQGLIRKAYNFLTDDLFLTATEGHNPMTRPVADFRNLPVRFYASYADTSVLRTAHTDPMAVRLTGYASELKVIDCLSGHATGDHFKDADTLTFYQRANGGC